METTIKTIGWNAAAELNNISMSGISFSEASRLFYSEEAAVCNCSDKEEKEMLIIGINDVSSELIVCRFTEEDGIINIISARKANKREKKHYEQYRQQDLR